MGIYNRDYTVLTNEELMEWEKVKLQENCSIGGKLKIRKNLFRQYPKAVRHYLSLFPNNYLDIEELQDEKKLYEFSNKYMELIDNDETNERMLLNFINQNKAFFIVASMLKSNFNFGHHDAYIFPEFQLGTSYKVDYLIVGKSSGGYEFVFVELEKPKGNITIQSGDFGETIRKGINQINDWKIWLDGNYSSLKENFNKYKSNTKPLSEEFYTLDTSRIHYVVVVGRRIDFIEKTYALKRRLEQSEKITLLHYDNLYDSALAIIGKATY